MIGLALLPGRAAAQGAPLTQSTATPVEGLSLQWNSTDPSCSDAAAIRSETQALLGGKLPEQPLLAHAEVTRDARGWRVLLTTDSADEHGAREIRGESCSSLQRAVALILALILDAAEPAGAAAPVQRAAEGVEARREASPVPPDAPGEAAQPPSSSSVHPRWLFGANAIGGVRVATELTLGIGGAATVALGPFEFGLGGRYWFPATDRLDLEDVPGATLRIRQQEFEATACWRVLQLPAPELALLGCVAPGVARVQVEAGGVTEPTHKSKALAMLTASVQLRYFPFGQYFITLTPALAWMQRLPFDLEIGPARLRRHVHETKDFSARGAIAVGVRF